jgi:exopolyphosphatase/guanosine-5'-triphosphate,3'-diphosphate pyrophosphatase
VSDRGGRVAAAIDVGSNSILLLTVALERDGFARAVDEAVVTTRLGAGLVADGPLDRAAVVRTRAGVVAFADRARARGADPIWAFVTGAGRRAADGEAFATALARSAGIPVEILSGEHEAALAYAAALHGMGLDDDRVLAIDVGGATTELTLGDGARVTASTSLPVGALVLTQACGADASWMARDVAAALAATDVPARARAASAMVAASGGTATSLAAVALGLSQYEPARVHGTSLVTDRILALATEAAGSTAIDPGRAAILPAGACILAHVLAETGARSVRVSDHGVRHAYLRARLAGIGESVSMRHLWS